MAKLLKVFKKNLKNSSNRSLEVYGDTIQDCLNAASEYFELEVEEMDYEILSKGKDYIFYKVPYHIRAFPFVEISDDNIQSSSVDSFTSNFSFNNEVVNKDENGNFFVKWNMNGVFVKVSPKKGNGKDVTLLEVEEYLKNRGVEKYKKSFLKEIVENKENKSIHLGTMVPSGKLAKYDIEVKDNDLNAFVTLYAPQYKERDLTEKDIERAIRDMRIIIDVDKKAVRHHINNCIFSTPFIAVKGKEPVYGKDAYIKYYVNTSNNNLLMENDSGQVDYKESSLIENVSKDKLLAEKIPKTLGQEGTDLFGVNIPASSGKDIKFHHIKGKGTYFSKDEMKLYASENGQVLYVDGKLKVEPVYETSEDIGPKTGNIRFNGSVVINGSVLDGYVVEADKDIEVKGTLQKGVLKAKGNIMIRGGCSGGGKVISESGTVYSKFVQNSEIDSSKDVIVSEGIVHSNVSSGCRIICSGKKASIIGGDIKVKELIIASNIGSAAAPKTNIEMGYAPVLIKEKYEIEEGIAKLVEDLKTVKMNLKSMEARKKADALSFDEEAQEELARLIQEDEKFQRLVEEERKKLDEFNHNMIKNGFSALIYIRERLFSNVFIKIKNASFSSKGTNKQSGCYFEEVGKINFNPLEGVKLQQELNKFSKKNRE